jgi:starch synthase
MRVLFLASELSPLEKTGGLADVAAGLPSALAALGVDVLAMIPGYPKALDTAIHKQVIASTDDFLGFGPTRLIAARTPDTGLAVYLVDCPKLYARSGGPYQNEEGQDWPDNAERFGLLCHAGALVGRGFGSGVPFDVIHLNDWQTGLVPAILAASPGLMPATVFTIHNLAFQGNFAPDVLPRLGLPDRFFSPDGIEFYGQLSFLKAGIRYSNRLTTVSPTYAREILTPEQGCGFDGMLRARADDLIGILNGVDYRIWDPRHDMGLPARFNDADLSGKKICKLNLQRQLGSGLIDHSQKMTVTAMQIADMKVWAHRS